MTTSVVAVGDVHGCFTLLSQQLEKYYGSNAELIFLGDLIDRSPEPQGDQKVIELVRTLQYSPGYFGLSGVTVLRGNHEQLCLDAMQKADMDSVLDWGMNGGSPDLSQYLLGRPDVLKWMDDLPYYAIRGNYLFVHAGVSPGVDIKEQDPNDLMWIRRPFLNNDHELPYTIVHGHTIQDSETPVYGDKRISIDLGAFATGNLCTLPLQV